MAASPAQPQGGWKKSENVAALTPAALVVALERDLLLSSLSRPCGSARAIVEATVPAKASARSRAAASLVTLVRRGRYLEALRCDAATALITGAGGGDDECDGGDDDDDDAARRYAAVDAAIASEAAAAAAEGVVELAAHRLRVLAVGVAALNAFTQANVTGPALKDASACPLRLSPRGAAAANAADATTTRDERWDKFARAALSLDGEDLVGRCYLPQYLYLARILLGNACEERLKALVGDDVDVLSATLPVVRAAATKAATKAAAAGGGAAGRVQLWPESTPAVPPPSTTWWASRASLVHQRLLSGRSPTLRASLLGTHALTLASYAPGNGAAHLAEAKRHAAAVQAENQKNQKNQNQNQNQKPSTAAASATTNAMLASVALLETALMEHEFGHVDSAAALTKAAGDAIACAHELTGAMGFRTIHQVDAKAQMVLNVACDAVPVYRLQKTDDAMGGLAGGADEYAASDDELDEKFAEEEASNAVAAEAAAIRKEKGDAAAFEAAASSAAMARIATELKGLSADGSQILTKPRILRDGETMKAVQTRRNASKGGAEADDEMAAASEATLPAVAQAILLAAAVTVRKSQADAGTRSWEMAPYHECVQSQMRSRPVLRAAAAVLSSRHERERPRTRERALLLMEDLVRGLDAKAPSAAARMRYAYSVWFPPGARLRKELGDQLVALGMVGAALELFEEIELWDSLIVCLTLLGKKQAAADTIRRRLAQDEDDPKLWCALGDALDDETHFHKALEVSDGKSARALRSLARRAGVREDWKDAAEYWSRAMRLNPLFPDGWFSAGFALLKAGREDEALVAFVRCTQQDSENGRGWNNVAALNIRKGSFAAAHVALQEATKQAHDSWQTWENLAMCAAKVGRFQQSARALIRVMDLTGGAKLHVATLSTLVERCKEARAGNASWIQTEAAAEEEEEKRARAAQRALGSIAELDDDDDDDDDAMETDTWEGVRAPGADGGGDAGDAAADLLGAFFSDSDDSDDDDDGDDGAKTKKEAAEAAIARANAAEEIAGEVTAREASRLEQAVEDVLKRALGGSSAGERSVKVRSMSHWSPYDRVGVVNAVP
jgi:hypothetical protein